MLRAIGGECAGALSLLPEGEEPSAEPQPYEALEAERVDELVAGEGEVPLLVGGSATRLSLAGAHDKLPVFVDSRELYVPLAHAPSTHILKLPHDRHKHVPQNEALTTWLAEELGFGKEANEIMGKGFRDLLATSGFASVRPRRNVRNEADTEYTGRLDRTSPIELSLQRPSWHILCIASKTIPSKFNIVCTFIAGGL